LFRNGVIVINNSFKMLMILPLGKTGFPHGPHGSKDGLSDAKWDLAPVMRGRNIFGNMLPTRQ
jgi:hypothetical protein